MSVIKAFLILLRLQEKKPLSNIFERCRALATMLFTSSSNVNPLKQWFLDRHKNYDMGWPFHNIINTWGRLQHNDEHHHPVLYLLMYQLNTSKAIQSNLVFTNQFISKFRLHQSKRLVLVNPNVTNGQWRKFADIKFWLYWSNCPYPVKFDRMRFDCMSIGLFTYELYKKV